MSSQGPKVSGSVIVNDPPVLNLIPASAAVTAGYAFDTDSIRDAGDWIRYKKQLLVFNENKSKSFKDPWFVRGNEYRLIWMQGRSKQPTVGTCVACDTGSGFIGNGPF
jgi:hypothetical protein